MYTLQRFLIMTLDPVHIGTGGYRLGRVDNSIVREPGTRVPKIPGTSLSGAARAYATMRYEKPTCAGQSGHCGQPTCPICYTFGYIKKDKSGDEKKTTAYSGVVNIFDARLLLFPVHSMAGPVWVTTKQRLEEAGFKVQKKGQGTTKEPAGGTAWVTWGRTDPLNLGWLMVNVAAQVQVTASEEWQNEERWKAVAHRIALVEEALFSHVVNSNLEVRTSVGIDPATGAAKEGALFTYEAIPRATWLWCDVVEDDYQRDPVTRESKFPRTEHKAKAERVQDEDGEERIVYRDNQGESLGETWQRPLDVVKAGLALAEMLGVGGMGTRGFGRITIVGEPVEEVWK